MTNASPWRCWRWRPCRLRRLGERPLVGDGRWDDDDAGTGNDTITAITIARRRGLRCAVQLRLPFLRL